MTTLFNIGDKIKFEIVGEIISYTADKNTDCYTIKLASSLDNDNPLADRFYISTDALKLSRAQLIGAADGRVPAEY